MIAVIFEVWPAEGQKETYLDLAAGLREELTKIDEFSCQTHMHWRQPHPINPVRLTFFSQSISALKS